MRLNLKLLPQDTLHGLYQSIARFPLTVSEKNLALYTQNARNDPRLAEVLTEHIRDFWWKYDPQVLNQKLKSQPWPEAIRPMLIQIFELCESDLHTRKKFGLWMSKALSGIGKAPAQLYFFSTGRPRSKSQDREVAESLPSFSKSGYFARDLLFNKGNPGTLKASAKGMNTIIDSEAGIKLQLLATLRPQLLGKTLLALTHETGFDRTTLSKVRSGKVERISVKLLARLSDRLAFSGLTKERL